MTGTAERAPVMVVHDAIFTEHDWPGHPENARRLEAIERHLHDDPVLDSLPSRLGSEVDLDLVQAVHTDRHILQVERTARGGGGWIDGDTYVTARSFEVARHAAGAAVAAAAAVAGGEAAHAYALVRPPGHHATASRPMGFCLFNNVAVAARALQRDHGMGRIAILDIDVHHGNGTQDVFYDDPGVLYVSLHQWPLYPGTGRAGERGEGHGAGATLNLPVPPGTGPEAWLQLLDELALPAIRSHRPDMILVSAGFDAHQDDPLASLLLQTETYADVARRIRTVCDETGMAGSAWVLEGGYDLEALPASVAATLHVLRQP